jgi:hypothetical protein
MEISIGTAIAEPRTEANVPALTLARFVSSLISNGSCFCCGSPTDLLLDSGGLIFVRCASCGAEIAPEETGCGDKSDLVLRAA